MNAKTRLLFRADGNSQIGLGHVVRCLALAELLQPDFDLAFAIRNPSAELASQIRNTCQHLISLPETDYLQETKTLVKGLTGQEIIVLDGYQFSTEYQKILKQKGNMLVCLDDLHHQQFVADVIINIAGGIKPDQYKMASYSRLYSGPAYALLRKPFREAQKTVSDTVKKPDRILICFGGADPENYTLQYVKKLHTLRTDLQLEIVLGSAYQHVTLLQEFASKISTVNLHQNLSAEEMAALMRNCTLALTSASSVAYEYCAVNGMLFTEKTADNQQDLYTYLISEGLALPASELETFLQSENTEEQTKILVQKQRQIFNGEAESNLTKIFRQVELQAKMHFRKFTQEDAEMLFSWANDPVVRQFSFSSEPILWETHLNWVNSKLANPNALLLLAQIDDQPAAFLRFDLNGKEALISYQIGAAFRGQGLGHRVLQLSLLELKKYFPETEKAIGFVQPQNVASVRAFEKAEFENLGIDKVKNAYQFEWRFQPS